MVFSLRILETELLSFRTYAPMGLFSDGLSDKFDKNPKIT
jgi:hypothetical protein